MERDILFRGKEVTSNKWIEGYIFKTDDGKSYIIPLHCKSIGECVTEIIPETIGQYTGLKDNSGNKIYEDDMIKVYHNRELLNVSYVYFSDGEYRCKLISGWFIDEIETLPEQRLELGIEVIGNMIDDCFTFSRKEK